MHKAQPEIDEIEQLLNDSKKQLNWPSKQAVQPRGPPSQLSVAPFDENSYFQWAQFLEWTEDYNQAIKFYEEILKINPNNKQANFNLGYIYFDIMKADKAIPYLKKASELDAKCLDSLNALALCYMMNEKVEETVQTFQRV